MYRPISEIGYPLRSRDCENYQCFQWDTKTSRKRRNLVLSLCFQCVRRHRTRSNRISYFRKATQRPAEHEISLRDGRQRRLNGLQRHFKHQALKKSRARGGAKSKGSGVVSRRSARCSAPRPQRARVPPMNYLNDLHRASEKGQHLTPIPPRYTTPWDTNHGHRRRAAKSSTKKREKT